MAETVKLVRLRKTDYTVRYNNGIKDIIYKWVGAKPNKKPFALSIPREVFDHLNLGTTAISTGALVIADDTPAKEELLEEVQNLDEAIANSHSYEEIVKLVKGNMQVMKKELSLVTARQEKIFIKSIAEKINDEEGLNNKKLEFINQWFEMNDDTEE